MHKNISGIMVAVLLLPLPLAAVSLSLLEVSRDGAVDFYQYWAAGRISAQDGPAVLYRPAGPELRGWSELLRIRAGRRGTTGRELAAARFRRSLEFYSTPLLFGTLSFLSPLPYDRALDIYRLLAAGALLAFFYLAVPALALPAWLAPLGAALTALLFLPWSIDLRVGNVNSLLLGGSGLLLYGLQRQIRRPGLFWVGALGGFLVLFKPVFLPALFLLAFSLSRARLLRQFLPGIVVGTTVGFLLPLLFFAPPASWFWWVKAWREMPLEVISPAKGNFAPSALWGGNRWFSLVVLLPAVWAVLRSRSRPGTTTESDLRPAAALSLGLLGALVISPLVWIHYSVLALPSLLLLLSPGCRAPWPWKLAGGAAGLLLFLTPLNLVLGAGGPTVDLPAMLLGLLGLYSVLTLVLGAGWCSGKISPALPAPGHRRVP